MSSHALLNQLLQDEPDIRKKIEMKIQFLDRLKKVLMRAEGESSEILYVKEDIKLEKYLEGRSGELILKLMIHSGPFREYCKKHPDLWHDDLVEDGFHGKTLLSTDGKECTNLQQYVGEYLFYKWRENKEDLDLLDAACEMNIYPALQARCNNNIILAAQKIADSAPIEEIEALENQIKSDAEHISHQYWAPGYAYSYFVFLKLAELHTKEILTEEDAAEAHIKNDFLYRALKCELMTEKLFNHPISQSVFKDHSFEKTLKDAMSTHEFSNLHDAEALVLEALRMDENNENYRKVKEEVEQEYHKIKI